MAPRFPQALILSSLVIPFIGADADLTCDTNLVFELTDITVRPWERIRKGERFCDYSSDTLTGQVAFSISQKSHVVGHEEGVVCAQYGNLILRAGYSFNRPIMYKGHRIEAHRDIPEAKKLSVRVWGSSMSLFMLHQISPQGRMLAHCI